MRLSTNDDMKRRFQPDVRMRRNLYNRSHKQSASESDGYKIK
jgi:hypothetical protein